MAVTKAADLQKELDKKLGDFDGDANAQHTAFIKALCAALQKQLLNYYSSGESDEDRLQRLGEISLMFRAMSFTNLQAAVGASSLQIAAKGVNADTNMADFSAGAYSCPPGTQCIDGNCV